MISCALVDSPRKVQMIFTDDDQMKACRFGVAGALAKWDRLIGSKLEIMALKVAGKISSMSHLWSEALAIMKNENRRKKYLRGPAYAPKE